MQVEIKSAFPLKYFPNLIPPLVMFSLICQVTDDLVQLLDKSGIEVIISESFSTDPKLQVSRLKVSNATPHVTVINIILSHVHVYSNTCTHTHTHTHTHILVQAFNRGRPKLF